MAINPITMFREHPKGLRVLFLTEMWERFSYYGMRALLILFLTGTLASGGWGMSAENAAAIYGLYTAGVYFAAIFGGWIADRLLGQRSAVFWGGVLIAMGHFSLAANFRPLFFAGLALIVLGTGLLKPNISCIVGQLYSPEDTRRDAGFTIFYMGINLGAFLGPLVCGTLVDKVGWHWGFAAAGFGMVFGLIQYRWGGSTLGSSGLLRERPKDAVALWAKVLSAIAAVGAVLYFLWDYCDLVVLLGTAGFFVWLVRQGKTSIEKKKIGAIMALFVFSTLFWAGFEQAGSSLNLFAERNTENSLFGFHFHPSYFQSVNALAIFLLAPVLASLWVRMGSRQPSVPVKFASGLFFVGAGFLVIALAANLPGRVAPMWLLVLYVLHTIGELCLSPVGLSAVTKLAPDRLVGTMMGVWFLSLSVGNFIGGRVAGYFESFPLPLLFGTVFGTTTAAGIILFLLVRPIRNLMSGVH